MRRESYRLDRCAVSLPVTGGAPEEMEQHARLTPLLLVVLPCRWRRRFLVAAESLRLGMSHPVHGRVPEARERVWARFTPPAGGETTYRLLVRGSYPERKACLLQRTGIGCMYHEGADQEIETGHERKRGQRIPSAPMKSESGDAYLNCALIYSRLSLAMNLVLIPLGQETSHS